MEDREGKKPFIIPKTHTSTSDVLISEKPESRNVIDLFNDIKSCTLEAQFDFRQNGCKSCDTIRNQKLQKSYNEKRIKMKKEQDPIERFAFHLITYRDVALNVANNGLTSEQLTFPIEKYLGNPKDGVHLSRRPDVLLASSGAQGLYRFGLLVCKVLLGKGYATIPSASNNQLPAQLHYDHHFCKIQSTNKEQRHVDDLLANSLIFCYEHENFETIPNPSQILPIAILWYDLTDRFSPELIPVTTQESQHRNGKISNGGKTMKKKTPNPLKKSELLLSNKPIISNSGAGEGVPQEPITIDTIESPMGRYPSHLMVPFQRTFSTPTVTTTPNVEPSPQQVITPIQQINTSRDPRLLRTKREPVSSSSDTIPLSPQHLLTERSLSDRPLVTKSLKVPSEQLLLITKSTSLIYIPLNSSTSLVDPRLKTLKTTRNIFYLELQAVKHALQQQKRLNHYYDPKSGLPPKTSYTLVPLLIRPVSNDEYERILNDDQNTYRFTKHSNGIDYSALYISVVDCFNFGLVEAKTSNQPYVDLEQTENKLAYEQIEMSNELIQREKQLNSQQMRLRWREKRQRRMQQQIIEKKTYEKSSSKSVLTSPSLSNSKLYMTTGRQLLKEHQISTVTPITQLSGDLLDFFSREYKSENRPHVKHLLAELVGVFMEKYQIEQNQLGRNKEENEETNHRLLEESTTDDQTMNTVIDMDIDSPSPTELRDHDERFRVPTPTPPPLPPPLPLPPLPPSSSEPLLSQLHTSLISTPTSSNERTKIYDDADYKDRSDKLMERFREHCRLKQLASSNSISTSNHESIIPTEEVVLKACFGQSESSSSENSLIDEPQALVINEDLPAKEAISIPLVQDDSNRSREEFVKLLTKEAYVSKSSSPTKKQNNPKRSYNYPESRRRSHDDNERKNPSNRSNFRRRYNRPPNKKPPPNKSSQKKVSTNRTVLISKRSNVANENQQNIGRSSDNHKDSQEEPHAKRLRVGSSSNTTDKLSNINQIDSGLKSIVTVPVIADDHDCRHDLNEKRRVNSPHSLVLSTSDNSRTKFSRSRSRSKSRDHHYERQRSSTNSHTSSKKDSKTFPKSQTYSRSPSKSNRTSYKDNQHRHQQQNRERQRSSDLSNHHPKQYSNQQSDRHELFHESSLRNPIPLIYHQRDISDLTHQTNFHPQRQPVRHKKYNYNHQSVADHPRFANPDALLPQTTLLNFDYRKSPPHHHGLSSMPIADRNVKSSYYSRSYLDRSESSSRTHSNSFDSKRSETIEQLHLILQSTAEQSEKDYSNKEPVKYSSSSSSTHENSHRSSSKSQSETPVQNTHQTYDSPEKLLTMVQRSRN